MHKLAFLSLCAFSTVWTFMPVNTIIFVRAGLRLLKSTTELLLAIVSQCEKLSFRQNMIMGILTIILRAFERVEIEHIASPRIKVLNGQPHRYTLVKVAGRYTKLWLNELVRSDGGCLLWGHWFALHGQNTICSDLGISFPSFQFLSHK